MSNTPAAPPVIRSQASRPQKPTRPKSTGKRSLDEELAVLLLLLLLPILGAEKRVEIRASWAGGAVAFAFGALPICSTHLCLCITKEDVRPPQDLRKEHQMTFVKCPRLAPSGAQNMEGLMELGRAHRTSALCDHQRLKSPRVGNREKKERSMGESLHCAHTVRTLRFWTRSSPKSPQAHPFRTPLNLGHPNYSSSTQMQANFPLYKTSCKMRKATHMSCFLFD